MWTLKKIIYRTIHGLMKFVLKAVKFPEPVLISGKGSLKELPGIIDKFTQTFKARTSHNIARVFWEYSG